MTTTTGTVTCDLTISIDGYAAGLNQTEQRPFGDDGGDGWGDRLHAWYGEGADEHPAEYPSAEIVMSQITLPIRLVIDLSSS